MLEPQGKQMVVTMLEHGLTNEREKLPGSDPVLETLSAVFSVVQSFIEDHDEAMKAIEAVCSEYSFEAAFEKFRNSCETRETRVFNCL